MYFEEDMLNLFLGSDKKEVKKYIRKFLNKEGMKLNKLTKKTARFKVKKRSKNKNKKAKYIENFRKGKPYIDVDGNWSIRVYNNRHIAHLLEDGHNIVRGGKIVGYVRGYKIVSNASRLYARKYYAECSKLLDTFLEEGGVL